MGASKTPLLVVDDVLPAPSALRAMAHSLGPFPAAANNYPGLRRVIEEADADAWAFVVDLLEAMTPYIAGAFDLDGFDLVEASFSLVTTPPHALSPVQRAPHFDSTDPDFYALMLYCSPCAGTAFYRHRASAIETVDAASLADYVKQARREATSVRPGYILGDTPAYERIGAVEGREGRFIGYPGRLLHSGIIPPGFAGEADPRRGRLTCNIFIKGRRDGP